MNSHWTESTPRTPIHDSFYIPWIDSESNTCFIDETNLPLEYILDHVYVPPSPIDPDVLARSHDPRKIYSKKMREITMESLDQNGRIVGGPHCLPPKPILYADVEARERALRTDGTQYDGPSGTVSWYYRADMADHQPIHPTSSVVRSQNSVPAFSVGECIGVDPLETIGGGDIPDWRRKEKTQSKKEDKRFNPIQKNKKKASPKKRKGN